MTYVIAMPLTPPKPGQSDFYDLKIGNRDYALCLRGENIRRLIALHDELVDDFMPNCGCIIGTINEET